MTKQTWKNQLNKKLHNLPVYQSEIDLEAVFAIVREMNGMVVDEAGEPWSGLLCGEQGSVNMEIVHPEHKNVYLHISWHTMTSSRYEFLSYAS